MQNTSFLQKVGLSEFHHRDGLGVSMSLFSMVTFIHSHRSSDAFRPHKQEHPRHLQKHYRVCSLLMPCATTSQSCTTAGCARAGGLAKSEWVVKGRLDMTRRASRQRKSSTYTRTELTLETKFGLIVEGLGYHSFRSWLRAPSPSLSSITTCCPTRACWTGRRSASAFPEHRLLELPRIMRSIPDKMVEMMQRRVVFVFEGFFKSLHPTLESARINLFSGDNAWQTAKDNAPM
ncbi:hypothetical protein PTSG_08930 [Salpingoeca rosetta]|uniref:Uncharacterized protein n=1 Tax=Salpingoeca rosetta (strain ATCC 50818 / BSB-021) TaxID=946362 RepID=F2ULQ3_SALR5|nr:uncharacterized protein PTSG_08930 [Salpingoeca rosetta]EGD78052.1 hypothetical protein PTSG_08930 [Salpingoeca rosetta]|eukprot:XP_004989728.1 hypothetical protein PTSG_08930 [Salpingoeca rosetta]